MSILSSKTRSSVANKARSDADSGQYTEYKGDTLTDVVFAPLDLLTGSHSTHEVARAKQDAYDRAYDSYTSKK